MLLLLLPLLRASTTVLGPNLVLLAFTICLVQLDTRHTSLPRLQRRRMRCLLLLRLGSHVGAHVGGRADGVQAG